jgi:drug/metabolite transporter (DMT)-like permease
MLSRRALSVPAALAVSVLAISSAAAVIRLADPLGPEVVACLRVTVTALGLWLVTSRASAKSLRLLAGSGRAAMLTILAGLCLAAHFGAWIASLSLTSVVRSVALVSTAAVRRTVRARAGGSGHAASVRGYGDRRDRYAGDGRPRHAERERERVDR